MKQDQTRQKLIDGTICVIAREGLDRATTKRISVETDINEVYIYRCFKDKEELFSRTFDFLDDELVAAFTEGMAVMNEKSVAFPLRCRLFFDSVWSLLLAKKERCLTYLRYYYSHYFIKNSFYDHKARFDPLVEKMSIVFKDEANVWMILNHILNVMLDFASKVHNGLMPSDDDYTEHVFRVVFESVRQYFKDNGEEEK